MWGRADDIRPYTGNDGLRFGRDDRWRRCLMFYAYCLLPTAYCLIKIGLFFCFGACHNKGMGAATNGQ